MKIINLAMNPISALPELKQTDPCYWSVSEPLLIKRESGYCVGTCELLDDEVVWLTSCSSRYQISDAIEWIYISEIEKLLSGDKENV